jgi:hypothetical protein
VIFNVVFCAISIVFALKQLVVNLIPFIYFTAMLFELLYQTLTFYFVTDFFCCFDVIDLLVNFIDFGVVF